MYDRQNGKNGQSQPESRRGNRNRETNEPVPEISGLGIAKSTPQAARPDTSLDPFDPANLRLSQDLQAGSKVRKLLTTVPVRKPAPEWFIRCRPGDEFQLDTIVIELKEKGEIYLVAPELLGSLESEVTCGPRRLVLAINRDGVPFLWPLKLPGPDGRSNSWNESALEAAKLALNSWVRVKSNMSLGAYEVFEAMSSLAHPQWPEESMADLLRIAFKDRYIDDYDHQVLKSLRGES